MPGESGGTADAPDLGSGARKGVEVRILSLAPPLTCRSLLIAFGETIPKTPSCSRLLTERAHATGFDTPQYLGLLPPRCSMMMTFGGLRAPWWAFARILISLALRSSRPPWQLKQSSHALGSYARSRHQGDQIHAPTELSDLEADLNASRIAARARLEPTVRSSIVQVGARLLLGGRSEEASCCGCRRPSFQGAGP
jgi:hypothetical protein